MFYCIYRLSDKGNNKVKLKNATKMKCLDNFIQEFSINNLVFIADNCEQSTIDDIKKRNIEPIETSNGNNGTFLYAYEYAINNFNDEDYVYLCEDDYFYMPGSKQVILEGLQIADYVSLYDHPDKYEGCSTINPFVNAGGEYTQVFLTKTTHWKLTNSTTMTFAASVKTLKEDYKHWKTYGINDFNGFRFLTGHYFSLEEKNLAQLENSHRRRLITPIPGLSTHCEIAFLTPLRDWSQY